MNFGCARAVTLSLNLCINITCHMHDCKISLNERSEAMLKLVIDTPDHPSWVTAYCCYGIVGTVQSKARTR